VIGATVRTYFFLSVAGFTFSTADWLEFSLGCLSAVAFFWEREAADWRSE
jgi:hypothetical protein